MDRHAVKASFGFSRLLALSLFITVFCLTSALAVEKDAVNPEGAEQNARISLTPEEQAWLAAHPDIALGASTSYPPFVVKRNDGTHVGVLVDYLEAASRLLNRRIRLHIEDPWAKVQEKAENREIDGLALGGRSPSRATLYHQTNPLFDTYFSVFGRTKDEYRLKQFSDLDGLRIGYRAGASPTRSLLEKLPSATLSSFDTHEEMTHALLSREVDVLAGWITYDFWRKEKMQGTIDNIYMIKEYPMVMVSHIRKDWPEFVSIMNKVIAAMEEDELPRIMDKWFIDWPAGFKPRGIQLTPEEQAWLAAHPNVTFGFTDAFEPFLIRGANGQHTGILVDLLKELNAQLGTRFTLEVDSWPVILEKVKQKEMGALLGVAHHTADAFGLLKTIPYTTVYPAFFARQDAPFAIKSLDDVRGKSVAILDKAKVMESILEPYGPDVDISRHADNRTPLQMVFEGQVDLAFGLSVHSYYIREYGLLGVKPVHTLLERPSKVGMAVRTDWPELVSILNKTIVAMQQDELPRIINRWYVDWPQGFKGHGVQLTPEERAWLDLNQTVRVRIVNYPPYQIIKDNQEPQGIVIEYLKLIEERTGIEFKFEVTDQPFGEFLESMKQGQGPDMTAIIVPIPERENYLSFTAPYLSSPYVIFIRREDNPILDIQGLFGKTLAVLHGTAVQGQLSKDYPEVKLALLDSDEKALQAVATGQADAYIGNLTVASHIIHQKGLSHLKVTAAAPFGNQVFSMGNRRDWPELTAIIDKALASITEEEQNAIWNKYLAIKYEQGMNKAEVLKWVLIVGGSSMGILLIFLFWNRKLRREISRREQTELALKQAKDEAEAANQAKTSFLASMSHELRTPLNAILGFSQLLVREQDTTAGQNDKLTTINRSGQHLLAMINDILDLSKIESGRIQLQESPFDLTAVVREVSMMIHSRATEKGLSFAVETGSINFPYVTADEVKLRQIVINLLNNAVKFTDEGGLIIRCATEPIPEEAKQCHIMIEVEDSGPGIDPARHEQIFEPFRQGIDAPERKGTGLGLSICKKYAEFMGGTIEVESKMGKGSLFRVRLPAAIAEGGDIETPVDDKPRVIGLAPTDKTWRILVADDNQANLLLLKSLLEKVGFAVLEARNGKEAVAAFENEWPDFVWMDMRMPVMDGYEAVRQIRKLPGGDAIPIIAITASAFNEQRPDILAAGCDDMVIKPFQAHEIFEALGRFLDLEYIYASEEEAAPLNAPEVELTRAMLTDLPKDMRRELREACLSLDREAIFAVVDRIEVLAPNTAKGLRDLVENYQIGRIRDLL